MDTFTKIFSYIRNGFLLLVILGVVLPFFAPIAKSYTPNDSLSKKIMVEADIKRYEVAYFDLKNFDKPKPFWLKLLKDYPILSFVLPFIIIYIIVQWFLIKNDVEFGDEIVDGTSVSIRVPVQISLVINALIFYLILIYPSVPELKNRLSNASEVVLKKELKQFVAIRNSLKDESDIEAIKKTYLNKIVKIKQECNSVECKNTDENNKNLFSMMEKEFI